MSQDFDRLREIFLEAVERYTPDQWDAYRDRVCAGDAELRRQAARLLSAHREGGGTLGPVRPDDRAGPHEPLAERSGTFIGRYKLLHQLGEGGMGTVYMAEQSEPVRRVVALKV